MAPSPPRGATGAALTPRAASHGPRWRWGALLGDVSVPVQICAHFLRLHNFDADADIMNTAHSDRWSAIGVECEMVLFWGGGAGQNKLQEFIAHTSLNCCKMCVHMMQTQGVN